MDVCSLLQSKKEAIQRIVELSEKDKAEHGITLCKLPDGSLYAIGEIYSDKEEALLPACPLGTESVGSVHTHPDSIPIPSELDILSSLEYDLDFTCVADDDKLYCVVFNKDHESYPSFKEKLLRLHDESVGSIVRGNYVKSTEIAEEMYYLIEKAFEEGVFKFETCKL